MREKFDRYIANMEEAAKLIKFRIAPGMSDEEILTLVHNGADRLRQLCVEDNALLDELVSSKTPETLTLQDAQELAEAADRLFHYPKGLDVGATLCIHRLLYAYAKKRGDRDMMIRELYHQGMSSFYLNLKIASMDVNVLESEIYRIFSEGASYFAQWDDIASEETRGYIIRCLGNRNLAIPRGLDSHGMVEGKTLEENYADYLRNFEETMRIAQSPLYREQCPGIPWDAFIYSLHQDRTTFLSSIRTKPNARIARDVLESAEYVYHYQENAARRKGQEIRNKRIVYIYAAARLHCGIISPRELMDTLLAVYQKADPADFSMDGIQLNIMYPQYLATYLEYLPSEEQQHYRPLVEQAIQNDYRYVLAMPRNEYITKVATALRDMMPSLGRDNAFSHIRMLDSILICHAPTYIHSSMVAWLNQRLTDRLIDVNPGALEGVFGFHGVDSIRAHRKQIGERAHFCGLYHDLGKSMIINYIGIYGRRLLDEEFRCIQCHPLMGSQLLRRFPEFEDAADVALFHHRSYNGKGGYPRVERPCIEQAREIAYITTVSDCIDAATDNIGRSYAVAKTYDTLVEELFQRSGTAYAPEIVELFQDQAFRDALGRDLVEYRRELYCKVYRELAEQPDPE